MMSQKRYTYDNSADRFATSNLNGSLASVNSVNSASSIASVNGSVDTGSYTSLNSVDTNNTSKSPPHKSTDHVKADSASPSSLVSNQQFDADLNYLLTSSSSASHTDGSNDPINDSLSTPKKVNIRNSQPKGQFSLPKLSSHMFRNKSSVDDLAREVRAVNLSDSDDESSPPRRNQNQGFRAKKSYGNLNGQTQSSQHQSAQTQSNYNNHNGNQRNNQNRNQDAYQNGQIGQAGHQNNGQITHGNDGRRLNRQKSADFRRIRSESVNQTPERKLNKSKSMDFRNARNDDQNNTHSQNGRSLNKKKSSSRLDQHKKPSTQSPSAPLQDISNTSIKELDEETETEFDDSMLSVEDASFTEMPETEKEKRRIRNKKRKERRARAKAAAIADATPSEGGSPIKTNSEDDTEIEEDNMVVREDVTLDSIFNDDELTTTDAESVAPSEDLVPPSALSRLGKLRTSSSKSLKFDTMNVLVSTYESESPTTEVERSEIRNMSNDRKVSIEETIRLNKKKSMEFTSSQLSQESTNPFDLIKLRSTKKSTMNSKYSEKLPEMQPIKTIIGLSHKQILNLDNADVKLKTIISTAKISKYASAGITFTSNHTDELFEDAEKKKIFVILCINVALYESIGFKKTVKVYPNVLELFGGYSEINLETTQTKLTPSNKDIHQNNLDYSVLSYIGHILIWAAHQQRQGRVELFTKEYDFPLSASLIRENVGGYHLWDRLIREPTGMNAKRWKHIIKFRQAFPYEEDQFMLILRFMKVDSNIP